MALFTIGDLHLSLGDQFKPMDIFNGWDGYVEKLEQNWKNTVAAADTVVLAGDTSWAMKLPNVYNDFKFIDSLPGKKIILKGNHDYWWSTMAKMERFVLENHFDTISFLFNNCYTYGKYGICGTRGWVSMGDRTEDEKVQFREVQRLEVSIKAAVDQGLEPVVFLHYPPVYGSSSNYDILDVLYRYGIKQCFYGHIHGYSQKNAITGIRDGVEYIMISSDYLSFAPYRVM
ncbi:metallophosphoesterase [Ruminococcus sp. HUN007]|uniref:metallophosphoesterase n=1 Tax=Ruminococcus sp. HUN007 TaxID=1514668 RepID=UPI0005D1F8C3|nr:metallophosphoesterase [Ruminococcus sp. HUN007]